MAHAIEQLLSSEVLSEEVRSTLTEAWEAKLAEAREEITFELREEFAQRYETDKEQMVEALDAMLGDTIKSELEEFSEDKKAAVAAKVHYQAQIAEHAKLLDQFVMETLKKEIQELRDDRKLQESNFEMLEGFDREEIIQYIKIKTYMPNCKIFNLYQGILFQIQQPLELQDLSGNIYSISYWFYQKNLLQYIMQQLPELGEFDIATESQEPGSNDMLESLNTHQDIFKMHLFQNPQGPQAMIIYH